MNLVRRYATATKWNIGFIQNPLEEIITGDSPISISWMRHDYKKGWFADPFILRTDDDYIYVLVEEFYYPIGRGRISKLTVNRRNYQLEKIDVVLELPTHLSFPAIARRDGKVYIYPENSASGKLTLYEYNETTNMCSPQEVLCNQPLTDAILTDLMGKPLIVSTKLPNPNKNVLGFYSEGQLIKEFRFDENIARNAGDWFDYDEKIYRPAQDCTKIYGGAVILQNICRNEFGEIEFQNVARLETDNDVYNLGFHTFNHYNGITVVDAKGYRFPKLNKLFVAVREIIGRK